MSFVHLHNHTHYSMLDGLARPHQYAEIAAKQKAPAVAITDHGVMHGAIDFYKECKKKDVKPIIGCEAYIAPHGIEKKQNGKEYRGYHLLLLAENQKGYENLMELCTKASLDGYYYKPRIDLELLKEHKKGIIGTSACLGGHISQVVMNEGEEKAIEVVKTYQDILGKENYFLELQDHKQISLQWEMNHKLIAISKETGAPIVATNDCHYAHKEDCDAHDVLVCIQCGHTVHEEERMKYESDFSMRCPESMKEAFKDHPEAIQNTLEIADRCKVDFNFGVNLIPAFDTPEKKDPHTYLKELCEEGLKKRYGDDITDEIRERLDYELKLIHEMGFDTYFLIVHDFIAYAKSKDIVVGPGRGSAAGSLLSYVLEITDVDPLKYGLFFERFLNPARVSMPDIDIDFADTRRDEVLDYVVEKYGRDKVAQIITFGTMAPKAAVRDVGRALGYPYAEVDKIAKTVPDPILGKHTPLKITTKDNAELSALYNHDERAKKLLDNAIKLEGTIRHSGTHACAVVISEEPLTKYTPLMRPSGKGAENGVVTQYSMKPLEELGLLKMDFLGLKNLTIMETTVDIVKKTKGKKIELNKIPLDDEDVFKLLSEGRTIGVFQLESAGMRRYLKELKPTVFEDIIAMVSLYRPGPMEWIPDYINRKHGKVEVEYIHPELEDILSETYGIGIYQEQILQIAQKFAGLSLGEADLLRRAIGKKIASELEAQKDKFIEGALEQGREKKLAKDIFEKVIEPFAGYGFNKSHATCYAMISYMTAYLKAHYPTEFMTALLTADSGNTDKIALEIEKCEGMGITVLAPSINESYSDFTYVEDGKIRFGLSAIKGIGEGPIGAIIAAREKGGKFKDIEDFAKRVESKVLNKKSIESLAFSGAMDEIGETKQIVANVPEIVKYAKAIQGQIDSSQTDMFGMMDDDSVPAVAFNLDEVEPATKFERLRWEKEYLGLYVSGHPLKDAKYYLSRKFKLAGSLSPKLDKQNGKIVGIVSSVKKILTKKGSEMAYIEIEDPTGRINVTVWPNVYAANSHLVEVNKLLSIGGRFQVRRDSVEMLANEMRALSVEAIMESAKEKGVLGVDIDGGSKKNLYKVELPEHVDRNKLKQLKDVLEKFKGGDTNVVIQIPYKDSLKKIELPFKVNVTDDLKSSVDSVLF